MIKYFFSRFYNSFNQNGFLPTVSKLPNKFKVFLRLIRLSKRERIIKVLYDDYMSLIPPDISMIANYALDKELLDKDNPKIISGGIHDDLAFEEGIYLLGAKVYCFDPTDTTRKIFSSDQGLSNKFHYTDAAIWTYDGLIKFFYPSDDGNFISDGSIGNKTDEDFKSFEDVKCCTIPTICKQNNISKLDYLKLDIEGAAPEVLISLFNDHKNKQYWPIQFCIELEFTKNEQSKLFEDTINLCENLLKLLVPIYELYLVPRDKEFSNLIVYGRKINNLK